MPYREPTLIKRLLDRLLATRDRRDREIRFSEAWQAADAEMHSIERAIFRVSSDEEEVPPAWPGPSAPPAPTAIHARDQRAFDRSHESERAG